MSFVNTLKVYIVDGPCGIHNVIPSFQIDI